MCSTFPATPDPAEGGIALDDVLFELYPLSVMRLDEPGCRLFCMRACLRGELWRCFLGDFDRGLAGCSSTADLNCSSGSLSVSGTEKKEVVEDEPGRLRVYDEPRVSSAKERLLCGSSPCRRTEPCDNAVLAAILYGTGERDAPWLSSTASNSAEGVRLSGFVCAVVPTKTCEAGRDAAANGLVGKAAM